MTALAEVHYLASTPVQRHLLDDAGREADINAVLLAARDLHVVGEELTETQCWNVTRILGRNAARVLAEVGEELVQADRFDSCSDRGDLLELIDDHGGSDWVRTAEDEADRWRRSARTVAETAVTR